MFTAMRDADEEPPVRGLAELMTAASARVSASKTPSRWQRLSVVLRQPPILAVTSIAILIGGALAISRSDAVNPRVPPHVPVEAPEHARELSPGASEVEQLSDDAGSAATRGDCETARALVTRIVRQAPAYYRDHVANAAAVARCLN